jgi:two-component system, OmpR family, phosphate regulon sensor histidine kinase PhoR
LSLIQTPFSFACNVLEALPEAVCLYLADSDLLFPNERWKAEIGEVSRLTDFRRLDIDALDLAARMKEAVSRGQSTPFSVPLDSGECRWLVVSPVSEQAGLFLFIVRDETEFRRVEQMRKDFIANVSHELRTPLTAVRGYVETLMDPQFLTVDYVQKFLPVIFEHTERLHNLMLDLLSLSRLESRDTHIDISPTSLAEEIEDAVEATAPLARMKQIKVVVQAPPDTLRVMANHEHLERVLVNLLDNAIKYSEPNDRIEVWTEQEEANVWTHVKDEGAGIATEELPRVFERFYRTKGAVSGKSRGSGLGLAIVKHIVQQLGGEIRVSSEVGKGSEFCFSLQVAE